MKKLKFLLVFMLFLLLFGAIFVYNPSVLQGVENGMYLCVNVVIPSLFPPLCLCACLAKTDFIAKVSNKCDRLAKWLFHLNGASIPIYFLSQISGFPAGAVSAKAACEQGIIDEDERNKITLISCGAGPGFVVIAVGVNMLGSYMLGVLLLVCHLVANALTAMIVSGFLRKKEKENIQKTSQKTVSNSFAEILVGGVSSATTSLIIICAFTVIFGTVISVLGDICAGSNLYLMLCGLLEVSNGCLVLCINNASICAISAVIGFSGISVICQIISIQPKTNSENRVKFSHLLLVRGIDAILSFFIAYIVLKLYPIEMQTFKTTVVTASPTSQNILFSLSLIALAIVFSMSLSPKTKRFVDFFK